ncbi:MAG: YcbK family protein [Methylobacter sp.]|uniref:YcbK family protein n=1 Tax=Methylobacter sp. TaxID=2051955 RepID=UPI00272F0DA9|nr:YcbK family protein [Methylobacter sp.]MDP1667118.1 YcbK family protein [Methylobacter sp.]
MNKPIIESINSNDDRFVASRRGFLKTVAGISLLTLSGIESLNAAVRSPPAHKTIALNHVHTGDKLKLTYFEQGDYIEDALQEINYLMRDYHTDAVHPIDPALLDQLYDLKLVLGINKSFVVTSGYRSPRTNARLRKKNRGIAKHSLHMQGRAIDLHVGGLDTRKIRNAALEMHRGGVGYCRRGNFVHLDTGSFRSWLS